MKRQTRIICTIGPASQSPSMLRKMARAGMNIARLNFSHGNHSQHQKIIDRIRKMNKECGFDVKILQDLEGYRIRLGHLNKPVELKKSQYVCLSMNPKHTKDNIPLEANVCISGIVKGMDVFINDGNVALKVVGVVGAKIKAEVLQAGYVSSRKGVNIPKLKLESNILTDKDRGDIEFGIKNKVDFVAQSFVRNKKDILQVVKRVKPYLPECQIIAKIENHKGVKNIDSIIDACDGIMVARGDLGVSLPIYEVPIIQKAIINRTNRKKKLDITATQMLESMTHHKRPTRAEVSDVANAILDGSDCVMLSGETAAGQYPVESVIMMRQIIDFTEKSLKQF